MTWVGARFENVDEELSLVVVREAVVDVIDAEVLVESLLVVLVVDVVLLAMDVVVKLAAVKPVPVGPTADVVLKTGNGGGDVVVGRAMELVDEAVELLRMNPGPGMGSVSSCPY